MHEFYAGVMSHAGVNGIWTTDAVAAALNA